MDVGVLIIVVTRLAMSSVGIVGVVGTILVAIAAAVCATETKQKQYGLSLMLD